MNLRLKWQLAEKRTEVICALWSPLQDLERAYQECEQADLIVCLGSSLTVSPANDLPKKVAKRDNNVVIVNLQRTPLDNLRFLDPDPG